LCRFFDLWREDFTKGEYVSVRAFDNYVRMAAGQRPDSCSMTGRCRAYPLIEADGSVYPCDFYAISEYPLGNIADKSFEELLTGEIARLFESATATIPSECAQCEFFPLCGGGCRRDREAAPGKPIGANRFCEAYKTFFGHAAPALRDIAISLFGKSVI
jgi:uncharacterized protein